MTKKAILKELIALEKKYKWLTADAIHDQVDLFEIQARIAKLMANLANETNTPIEKEIPYLFYTTETNR